MPIKTALTEALGIQVPIVQGGMMWVGYAELASAVSNAGGLGILTALTQPSPEALKLEIRKCRAMTQRPFGVNITMLPALNPPNYRAYAQAVIDERVTIVETAGSSPGPIIKMLKDAGIWIIHKAISVKHAQSAVKLGVDFLSIDSFECAGHLGENPIGGMVLLNKARQSLGKPFIASGGIADGYGLAAALALGASGANLGTRFMTTLEAPIHMNIKQEIVRAQEGDTKIVMKKFRNSSRLYNNKVASEALAIEQDPATKDFSAIQPYVSGQRGRRVFIDGDVDAGVWTAGQVIGVINDIPTCAELVKRIEREAEECIAKNNALIVGQSKL